MLFAKATNLSLASLKILATYSSLFSTNFLVFSSCDEEASTLAFEEISTNSLASNASASFLASALIWLYASSSVSYTHLDVYKRQILPLFNTDTIVPSLR